MRVNANFASQESLLLAGDLRVLRFCLAGICVLFAGVATIQVRYVVSPDSISYLDVGAAFARGDLGGAISSYWSPIFPWLLGIIVHFGHITGKAQFATIHVLNFLFFLAALYIFDRFVRAVLDSAPTLSGSIYLRPTVVLLTYTSFIYTVIPVMQAPTPDMLLCVVVLAIGLVLWSYQRDGNKRIVLVGVLFGIGYLVKAIMLPLGVATLLTALLIEIFRRQTPKFVIAAIFSMLFIASPFVFEISKRSGHLNTGDSGRLTYTWFLETPLNENSTLFEAKAFFPLGALVRSDPRIYRIETKPFVTFSPWFDPASATKGVAAHFTLSKQMRVLGRTLKDYRNLLVFNGYEFLLFSVLLLFAFCGTNVFRCVRLVVLIVFCLAALATYALVLVEPRYVYPFGYLLFLTLLGIALGGLRENAIAAVQRVLAVTLLVFLLQTFPTFVFRTAVSEPQRELSQEVSDALHASGLNSGDNVAVADWPYYQYWAKLGDLTISAYMPSSDMPKFCDANGSPRPELTAALRSTGARWLVAKDVQDCAAGDWKTISGTGYRFIRL